MVLEITSVSILREGEYVVRSIRDPVSPLWTVTIDDMGASEVHEPWWVGAAAGSALGVDQTTARCQDLVGPRYISSPWAIY